MEKQNTNAPDRSLGNGMIYSCGGMWSLDKPETIAPDIEQIAHALSKIYRWNGNADRRISVAEHSINVRRLLKRRGACTLSQMVGLIHDTPEVIFGDISAPLKKRLFISQGKKPFSLSLELYEKRLLTFFAEKLIPGFRLETCQRCWMEVDQADSDIRTFEFPEFYGVGRDVDPAKFFDARTVGFSLLKLNSKKAERVFLEMYRELCEALVIVVKIV